MERRLSEIVCWVLLNSIFFILHSNNKFKTKIVLKLFYDNEQNLLILISFNNFLSYIMFP